MGEGCVKRRIAPRTPVARLLKKDGREYWVKGFSIYDPVGNNCHRNGFSPYTLKSLKPGYEWVVRSGGQAAKPVQIPLKNLEKIQPGKDYKAFAEVFG